MKQITLLQSCYHRTEKFSIMHAKRYLIEIYQMDIIGIHKMQHLAVLPILTKIYPGLQILRSRLTYHLNRPGGYGSNDTFLVSNLNRIMAKLSVMGKVEIIGLLLCFKRTQIHAHTFHIPTFLYRNSTLWNLQQYIQLNRQRSWISQDNLTAINLIYKEFIQR